MSLARKSSMAAWACLILQDSDTSFFHERDRCSKFWLTCIFVIVAKHIMVDQSVSVLDD
jgi:hypothetical protein